MINKVNNWWDQHGPNGWFITLFFVALSLLLPACAFDIQEVRELKSDGDSFNEALAREYKNIALYEADKMYDWPDAAHFARKAIAAAKGEAIEPERIENWDISDDAAPALTNARISLVSSLNNGFKDKQPKKAANAQAAFDCWLEQQEEGWQTAHIEKCRKTFTDHLENWENRVKVQSLIIPESSDSKPTKTVFETRNTSKEPLAVSSIIPTSIMATSVGPLSGAITQDLEALSDAEEILTPQVVTNTRDIENNTCKTLMSIAKTNQYTYRALFAHNSHSLSQVADMALRESALKAKTLDTVEIFVAGHTDRSGTEEYNLELSVQRTLAVWKRLINLGISPNNIWLGPRGETSPLVAVADGVREAKDRRVQINIIEGTDKELAHMEACTETKQFSTKSIPTFYRTNKQRG